MKRDPDPISRTRADFLEHALIRYWIEPRRHSVQPMSRVSEAFLELGDLQFAQFASLCSIMTRLLIGDWVEPVERDLRELLEADANPGGPTMDIQLAHQAYRTLLPGGGDPATIEAQAPVYSLSGAPRMLGPLASVTRMLVLAVYGNFAAVFEESERIYPDLFRRAPALHIVDHMFLRGLAAAALAPSVRGRPRGTGPKT